MKASRLIFTLCCCITAAALTAGAAEPTWKAGWASAVITPQSPMWMAGFGNRTQTSDGTLQDLQLKSLVLQDGRGHRAVLVAGDLLGIPKSIYDNTCASLKEQFGLDRAQIMLNSSHSHNTPVLRGALLDVYPLDNEQLKRIEDYSTWLEAQIVKTVAAALDRMKPVELFRGQGHCGFSFDRQWDQVDEWIQDVPVLAVRSPGGKLEVVVMTYACHPTSLKRAGWKHGEYANLLQKWAPDFPHFAVARIESQHSGVMAMFTQGCGADRSAPQEGQLSKTSELGFMLSAAVQQVLSQPMQPIEPQLATQLRFVELDFGEVPTRDFLQEQLKQTGGNQFLARWARRLLKQMDSAEPFPRTYQEFPVQVWKLGHEHLWVSLGGETVSGYSVRIRQEIFPNATVFGYTNDVMAYIPTPEIIRQGGYIGQSSMAVYGVPAMRWSGNIEERILSTVRDLASEATSK